MQILYKYERNWSKAAQSNWVWVLLKLAYTQISLQYFGAALLTQQRSSLNDASLWLLVEQETTGMSWH